MEICPDIKNRNIYKIIGATIGGHEKQKDTNPLVASNSQEIK